LNEQNKKYLVVAVILVVFVALGTSLFSAEVLSVDRIWLYERGVGSEGEELQGGVWRVTATTSDTKIQYLHLNDQTMEANQQYSGDFPSDVDVNGMIYVKVSQPYNPYWIIPITDLGTIEVVPEMQGIHIVDGATGGVAADSVKVRLWSLNLAQKKVIIPFEVVAAKTLGENSGYLKTDDSRAKEVIDAEGYQAYQFEISQSDIVDGQLSQIPFYNPLDTSETMKFTLQWVFGDYDKYSWNENLLFVTAEDVEDVTPRTEITFLASNEQAIKSQLSWQSGNDWSFCRYWYGGGNVFKGSSQKAIGSLFTGTIIDGIPGKSQGLVRAPPPSATLEHLAEGFKSRTTTQIDIFEYPGWYTPNKHAVEVPDNWEEPNDWMYWRRPLTPNVLSDTASNPEGLSILNYLASSVKAPVTGLVHTPFPNRNPDVWGEGVGGYIGTEGRIAVLLPTAARKWLFTLDVSTQLADTVVVLQDYIDVSIVTPLSFDQTTLSSGETATGTVKLKNNSPFSGVVSVKIDSPNNLKYTTTISGTGSALSFGAGEEKLLNIQVTNTGLLDEQETGTFKLTVTNQEPRETASQSFTMTFKPGLGVPNSLLAVTTKDADSGAKISGITLNARWGVDNEHSRSATTSNGEATLDLDKFEGPVTVVAKDYTDTYESEETVVQVEPGTSTLTFHLIKKTTPGGSGLDWSLVVLVLGVSSIAAMSLFGLRRKR